MASILFTDASSLTWLLHNGKRFPADRFDGWTPSSVPFGDSVARQSDGATTMFRLRDDFSAAFALSKIPSKRRSNLLLYSQKLDQAGAWAAGNAVVTADVGNAPDGSLTADRLDDSSNSAIRNRNQIVTVTADTSSYVVQAFVKQETVTAWPALVLSFTDGVTPIRFGVGTDYLGNAYVIASDSSGNAYGVPTSQGVEYAGNGWWMLWLVAPNQGTGYTSATVLLYPARSSANAASTSINNAGIGTAQFWGAWLYTGTAPTFDYLMTEGAARSNISSVEIADKLRYHLLNGGTCQVNVNDPASNIYATCGLKPGTTPQLQLTDRRTLEYTLSLELLNLAGSPAAMHARYAEI